MLWTVLSQYYHVGASNCQQKCYRQTKKKYGQKSHTKYLFSTSRNANKVPFIEIYWKYISVLASVNIIMFDGHFGSLYRSHAFISNNKKAQMDVTQHDEISSNNIILFLVQQIINCTKYWIATQQIMEWMKHGYWDNSFTWKAIFTGISKVI